MNPRQELQALEQLLDQLLKGIQDVLQSGEILSDEFQMMLAQELTATTDRIDQLQVELQQAPVEGLTPPIEPGMESSNVEGFAYDPEMQKLFVRFLGKYPDRNGPIYSYEGVPNVIFDLFQKGAIPARTDGQNAWGKWWKGKVPSMGASMYTLIKGGGYPYQKVS